MGLLYLPFFTIICRGILRDIERLDLVLTFVTIPAFGRGGSEGS